MTDRRSGSVGLTVDLVWTAVVDRRTGSVGLMVDVAQAAVTSLSGSTTQPHTLSLTRNTTLSRTLAQGQVATVEMVVVSGAVQIAVATAQAQAVTVTRAGTLHVALTQTTQTSLVQQLVRGVITSATQAQTVSVALARGYQRIVTATQATAVARQRVISLMRKLAGQGVRTRVERKPEFHIQPTVTATARTQVRLIRQVQLTRSLAQPQTTSTTLVHVDVMQTVATTQRQSLALQQDVILAPRSVTQAQAVVLPRGLELLHTFVQPTALVLGRVIDLVRAITVGSSAGLELEDVTVRYDVLVTTTVGQAVALSTSSTGVTAKQFRIRGRDAAFVVAGSLESIRYSWS